jgi:hypothetical protein
MTGRSSLRRQSSAMKCGANGEENREDEEILTPCILNKQEVILALCNTVRICTSLPQFLK